MDGVYLHGHEGYLLDQLTSPAFNHRKIGKYADWQRFGVDMIKAIRRKVGPNYPIMYRIDLSLALNETYGDRMDTVKSLKGLQERPLHRRYPELYGEPGEGRRRYVRCGPGLL